MEINSRNIVINFCFHFECIISLFFFYCWSMQWRYHFLLLSYFLIILKTCKYELLTKTMFLALTWMLKKLLFNTSTIAHKIYSIFWKSSKEFGFLIWRENLSSDEEIKFFRRTLVGLEILPEYASFLQVECTVYPDHL